MLLGYGEKRDDVAQGQTAMVAMVPADDNIRSHECQECKKAKYFFTPTVSKRKRCAIE